MKSIEVSESGWKLFFDLWYLLRRFDFDGETLKRAIVNTFERRGTELPAQRPFALTESYTEDANHRSQWNAFLKKSGMTAEETPSLTTVANDIAAFLVPVLRAASARQRLDLAWSHKEQAWRAKPST